MAHHRTNYKNYLDGKQNYVSSYEILKHGDANIELIYEGEFESKSEMQKREGQEIRNTNCVNKNIAGRTYQEYYKDNKAQLLENVKQYYDENRDKILEQRHDYYEKNRETFSEQQKQYYDENRDKILEQQHKYYEQNREKINHKSTCECGGHFTQVNKALHLKTKKHKLFLQNQNLNIVPV
jgi:hypothetical protein